MKKLYWQMNKLLMVEDGDPMLRLIRKKLSQWFFNITKFSDELLTDLDSLEGWPEKVKLMQKNWIGKSFGCEINFKLSGIEDEIKIFTTRPDTIFGASFIALSTDHPVK